VNGLAKGGGDQKSLAKITGSKTDLVIAPPTLAEAGIDKHLADRARKLAAPPETTFEAAVERRRQGSSTQRLTASHISLSAMISGALLGSRTLN
jgi:hypothetical protein